MAKSDIGARKILEAKQHLAAQQKADRAAEKAAQKAAHAAAQTTKRGIAGRLRGPILHNTALQQSLQAEPDYLVPKKLVKVKPAVSAKG
jgi:hypothetical protein